MTATIQAEKATSGTQKAKIPFHASGPSLKIITAPPGSAKRAYQALR